MNPDADIVEGSVYLLRNARSQGVAHVALTMISQEST
jgi:hypothetical protein